MLVQRKWMYLESIFIGSDDIRNQLPQEAKRFDTIDKAWLKIMADTAKNTNVLEACSADGRLVLGLAAHRTVGAVMPCSPALILVAQPPHASSASALRTLYAS